MAHMSVPDGGPNGGMAQQRLHKPYIGTLFQEMTGKGVAKAMHGGFLLKADLAHRFLKDLTYGTRADVAIGLLSWEQIDPLGPNLPVAFTK